MKVFCVTKSSLNLFLKGRNKLGKCDFNALKRFIENSNVSEKMYTSKAYTCSFTAFISNTSAASALNQLKKIPYFYKSSDPCLGLSGRTVVLIDHEVLRWLMDKGILPDAKDYLPIEVEVDNDTKIKKKDNNVNPGSTDADYELYNMIYKYINISRTKGKDNKIKILNMIKSLIDGIINLQ